MFYERRENIRMMEDLERRALTEPREERRVVSDTDLFKIMKINPQGGPDGH